MYKEKESNFISFVGYVHNNEKQIKEFVDMCVKIGEENFKKYEIILVDDDSKDNSIANIKNLCKEENCVVSIMKMSSFQGVDRSLTAGTDFAIGDYVFEFNNITIDYSIELIMQAYKKLQQGNDIVSVSPKSRCKKLFYTIYNHYKKKENKIVSTRFRLISRRAINRVSSTNTKIIYRKAVFADCGLKNSIIYYKPIRKIKNKKIKAKNRESITAYEGLLAYTNISIDISGIICLIMFILGFGFLTNIIYCACLGLKINLVYSILCFTSFGLGLTNIILLLMFRYTKIITSSQLHKKEYLIENIEKVNKN